MIWRKWVWKNSLWSLCTKGVRRGVGRKTREEATSMLLVGGEQ